MLAMFESPESWLYVAAVAALLFGSSKLPQLARSLGRSKSEFEKALREGKGDDDDDSDDPPMTEKLGESPAAGAPAADAGEGHASADEPGER